MTMRSVPPRAELPYTQDIVAQSVSACPANEQSRAALSCDGPRRHAAPALAGTHSTNSVGTSRGSCQR